MLIDLIVSGIIPQGGTDIEPGTGTVTAPPGRTARASTLAAAAGAGAGIPPTAFPWAEPLDPADRTLYVMDWSDKLGSAKIDTIRRLTMSALGASLGVQVDTDADRIPILDTEGQKIGLWFKVGSAFQESTAFAAPGIKVGIAALIRTDEVPYQEFERTWELTVAQL